MGKIIPILRVSGETNGNYEYQDWVGVRSLRSLLSLRSLRSIRSHFRIYRTSANMYADIFLTLQCFGDIVV